MIGMGGFEMTREEIKSAAICPIGVWAGWQEWHEWCEMWREESEEEA